MPKPPSARAVLRSRADGAHVLFTRNLGLLRRRLGMEVFNAFVCSFIQSDRIDSLIAFLHLNILHLEKHAEQSARNYQATAVFLVGTMFELALALDRLRSALIRGGLATKEEWTSKLGPRWDSHWRNSSWASTFRSKAAFHVDPAYIEAGLGRLRQTGRVDIFQYASERQQEGIFLLGASALLRGHGSDASALNTFVTDFLPDLKVYQPLADLFLLALERADLSPRRETRKA